MTRLPADEVNARLTSLPGWKLTGEGIERQFVFRGFPEAIAFVVRLGFAAEAADHHPEMEIAYTRVTLRYSTHSAGGLTERDFAGAREATALAIA